MKRFALGTLIFVFFVTLAAATTQEAFADPWWNDKNFKDANDTSVNVQDASNCLAQRTSAWKIESGLSLPSFGTSSGPVSPGGSPTQFIGWLLIFGFGLAGVSALLMIVLGGVQYMASEVVGQKAQAKERIQNALLGLALLMASVLILATINPDLLLLKEPKLGKNIPANVKNAAADCSCPWSSTPCKPQTNPPFPGGGGGGKPL